MIVIIAEKPSVAREIAAIVRANEKEDGYLSGDHYTVTWAFGHLITLAMPETYGITGYQKESLPIIPETFILQPKQLKIQKEYKPDPGALKQLNIIARLFKTCDSIIVATDAGREGELIFRYIYQYLNIIKPFQRLWISSLTEKAIRAGLENLKAGNQYDSLYFAAKARSEADWLIGINASQALSIAAGQGSYSLGRVQTPTLKMICNRYHENKDFKSSNFWQLQIKGAKDGVEFNCNSELKFDNEATAMELQNKITQQGDFLVSSVETKESKLNPPLLFDLTTLQKEAIKKLGYSADQTLSIAQALYEKKYITYPRTGSRYISQDILETIPDLIVNLATNSKFTAQALTIASLNHLAVNDSKVTDHHAILITETNSNTLKNEEEAIYNLIASRLLEAFSPECIKDITTVKIKSADVLFILKGAIIKQIGWKAVLNEIEEKQDEDFTLNMPPLTEGEILPLSAITTLKGQTKPKPLLTEASLLSQMETAGKDLDNEKEREAMKGLGLGTPATRAAIIETLITREYIKREKKSLVPTEKGLRVYELVKNMRISDIAMTGEWESTLSRIESTDISPETFQSAISIYTRQITEELLSSNIATQQDCPKCKTGKLRTYSKVIKCTNEQCQLPIFKEKSGKQITDLQISDLLTKGKTSIIKGFVSKSGKKFDASLAFDDQFQVVFVFDKKPFKKKDK